MDTAFLNGEFVEVGAARVSALDAAVQHGVGLFETLQGGVARGESGGGGGDEMEGVWALMLDEHLERLAGSAAALGLSAGLNVSALREAALRTVARGGHARARVRITITGGDLNLLNAARASAAKGEPRAAQGTVLITAQELPALGARGEGTEGPRTARVRIADARANPFNPFEAHKTLNYWWRLRELAAAAATGAGEALVFSVTNHLVGGCVSSVLLINGGEALAPIALGEERLQKAASGAAALIASATGGADAGAPASAGGISLPSPVRPGITRAWAIDELAGEGIITRKRMLTIEDVLRADEIILLGSIAGPVAVGHVEAHAVGRGGVGEVGALLDARWRREVRVAQGLPA